MSDDYTPATDEVRSRWENSLSHGCANREAMADADWEDERMVAEFNRWLAQVRAEAQVQALREVAKDREWLDAAARSGMNGYGGPFAWNAAKGVRDYLYTRADRIAREAGIETGESND